MAALSTIPTCELVEELINREGVEELLVEPYEFYSMEVGCGGTHGEGPARILIVTD
jgi:hypothetical protein